MSIESVRLLRLKKHERRPCIAHMHVFGRVAYAMVLNEKWGKFDAKDTNCLFLGYCKGSKAYRLMCLQD